ncbi:uncharacterized protein [Drosophila bipectinata]|uniref:uncharacterized protein n=1 Tax=Drosophila bipectinata TaxID=42026 RepID=UPI001C8A6709|nr:uncharacterized protein LOC108124147 [Drosophila bipectinata]
MCWGAMARKDDPVFNVRFVQLVETEPCLWNYNHPGYSKKEEVQEAWQQVANESKDTVRNCRERWRTIRSSFLRSLKLAGTQTGRGKRKYYLSKYLQFLIPFTKSRACRLQQNANAGASTAGMVLRKPGSVLMPGHEPPGAEIEDAEEEQTKESVKEEEMPLDVQVSEMEDKDLPPPPTDRAARATLATSCLPVNLQAIKVEQPQPQSQSSSQNTGQGNHKSLVPVPATTLVRRNGLEFAGLPPWFKLANKRFVRRPGLGYNCGRDTGPPSGVESGTGPSLSLPPPDADYSFLISLHPYLKEMNGKQNRRFRQKVVGLIDKVLDNTDT